MATEPIVISIEERTYPRFKESAIGKRTRDIVPDDLEYVPFGPDYAGKFIFKHPTLGDRTKVDAAKANSLAKAGFKSAADASPVIDDQEYALAVIEALATEKPEWCSRDGLSTSLDQLAVIEVGKAFNEAVELKKKKSTNGSSSTS